MPNSKPFAYNPSLIPISGTTQIGELIYGTPISGFTDSPQFWMGPDEDLKYIIGFQNSLGNQPNPVGIPSYVQFWGCPKTDSDFINLSEFIARKNGTPQVFTTADDAKIWLNSQGYFTSYNEFVTPTPTPSFTPTPSPTQQSLINPILVGNDEYLEVGADEYLMFVDPSGPTPTPSVTPSNTESPTPTPSVTNTQTPSVTPTFTPTPSATPIPVTGFGYNLIVLPYNFPTSGNSIMNAASPSQTGTTLINELTITQRGFYFNSTDNIGVDRTSYFSQFTGQSVSVTFTQNGDSAIYSGDSQAFKFWSGNTGTPPGVPGTGFVFGTNIGVPPSGTPSGAAILIQSATTTWVTGATVYVSVQSST